MVQNNKVLTVSYGTFSCTLEGFDDSFETMKAIAEYFRDLAAEDRYFGSEPPQPDAEMLTRIAQRDAAQRVEARPSETGLLLRATETPPSPDPATSGDHEETSSRDLNVVQTPPAAATEPERDEPFFAQAEPVEAAPEPAPDSLAAKLQRIRAVVSHSDVNNEAYSEDDVTPLQSSKPAPIDAVAAAFEAGTLSPEDLTPETPATPDTPVSDAQPDPSAESEEPPLTSDDSAPEALTPFETSAPETKPEPVVETTASDLMVEEEPAPQETLVLTEESAVEAAPEMAAAEETPGKTVSFTEFDEDGDKEDEVVNILSDTDGSEDPEELTVAQDAATDGVLTAEDEASLFSEISEIEMELLDQPQTGESDLDQDVSRLMARADEQMDDPVASDTRETYSHLRTAVAATEAEGAVKDTSPDDEYRGDLASVVSPRRPEIQVTSMRPESDAAAPLKLVAEQRVDDPDADTGPVTPRRVTAEQTEELFEEGGFAQFAQDQGAQSLSDLLEAAAAYLSFIEGQEQFSRPQLMNKVRSLKQDEFNREESLRSFGQLLRDGKIEKAGGGRFAASNLIGFRPDDERAAG